MQRKSAKGRRNHHRHLRARWEDQARRRKIRIARQEQAIREQILREKIMREVFTVKVTA